MNRTVREGGAFQMSLLLPASRLSLAMAYATSALLTGLLVVQYAFSAEI
jgi:hypothetical protein